MHPPPQSLVHNAYQPLYILPIAQRTVEEKFSRLELRFTAWCEQLTDDLRHEVEDRKAGDAMFVDKLDIITQEYRSFAAEVGALLCMMFVSGGVDVCMYAYDLLLYSP